MKVTLSIVAVFAAVLALAQGHSYHLGATCPKVDPQPNFDLDKVSLIL
jgi:hypothetical protein